ncbi:hypothetical protein M5689_013255 [Euphorbia peplus]|nr:hypothetical protein M5689_013255 [Euphorbia peplus]
MAFDVIIENGCLDKEVGGKGGLDDVSMDDLREVKMREKGASFGNERKGVVVRLKAFLFHVAEEDEGFVGVVLIDGMSYPFVV